MYMLSRYCFVPYSWPLAATVEVFSHTSSTFNELNEHCASSPVKLFACATNDHSLHSSPLIATIIVCVPISRKGMMWRSERDCSWIMIYNAYTVSAANAVGPCKVRLLLWAKLLFCVQNIGRPTLWSVSSLHILTKVQEFNSARNVTERNKICELKE